MAALLVNTVGSGSDAKTADALMRATGIINATALNFISLSLFSLFSK
jgi:hypothetical protein